MFRENALFNFGLGLFLDIKKSNSWYLEIEFLISRNLFLDIKNDNISWYQEMIFWYQEFDFFYIKKWVLFLDIKKSNSWYEEMHF